ncbi:hypothetical protein Tco_1057696 [Tanacetum coccineum]|uniref:Uncharacterized protein n=1 Tax=Tanacetum coccineum TaxID=301880 RepID=A0ABQ5H7I6_9ASTR
MTSWYKGLKTKQKRYEVRCQYEVQTAGSVRGWAFKDSRRTRRALLLAQNGINSLASVVILGLDPDATVANHWKLMRRWELRIDQRAPISGSIIGWIPERMKLPLPILGLYKSTDAAI